LPCRIVIDKGSAQDCCTGTLHKIFVRTCCANIPCRNVVQQTRHLGILIIPRRALRSKLRSGAAWARLLTVSQQYPPSRLGSSRGSSFFPHRQPGFLFKPRPEDGAVEAVDGEQRAVADDVVSSYVTPFSPVRPDSVSDTREPDF
jgi:hypothetical protein